MIKRTLFDIILKNKGKAIIVLGPRQTGKTTLLNAVAENLGNCLLLDCDDLLVRKMLEDVNTEQIKQLIGDYKVVFIDEAQRVKNIGLILKIITDRFKHVQLLVSGSTALELANEINEPLTGRKWEYMLYPISWQELTEHSGYLSAIQQLENRLIYGMFPEVVSNTQNINQILKQLSGSLLYKDILSLSGIRKPEIIERLLQALAIQLGNEVSFNELASILQIDKNTVRSYIDLLEKSFIVFHLNPFCRNVRNEISSNRKIYFYDNGLRNALIANFNPLSLRNDIGSLWENFLISERMKLNMYKQQLVNCYFWRTKQQQEIDYIEEKNGSLFAYEFKWNPNAKVKFSATFLNNYNTATTAVIHRENFNDFLLKIE